jgi:hypothetical protein
MKASQKKKKIKAAQKRFLELEADVASDSDEDMKTER